MLNLSNVTLNIKSIYLQTPERIESMLFLFEIALQMAC